MTPLVALLVIAAVSVLGGPAHAAPPRAAEASRPAEAPRVAEEVEGCLGCHGDRSLTTKLPSGEELPLFVDQQAWARSVHGDKLGCLECHARMSEVPHPAQPFRSRRELTIASYEQSGAWASRT